MKKQYVLEEHEFRTLQLYASYALDSDPHVLCDTAEAETLIKLLSADTDNDDYADEVHICENFIRNVRA